MSHTTGLIHTRDDAKIFLEDDKGNTHKAILKNVLYFPTID